MHVDVECDYMTRATGKLKTAVASVVLARKRTCHDLKDCAAPAQVCAVVSV